MMLGLSSKLGPAELDLYTDRCMSPYPHPDASRHRTGISRGYCRYKDEEMLKPGVSSGFMASSAAVLATNVPTLVAECSGSIASLTLGEGMNGQGLTLQVT